MNVEIGLLLYVMCPIGIFGLRPGYPRTGEQGRDLPPDLIGDIVNERQRFQNRPSKLIEDIIRDEAAIRKLPNELINDKMNEIHGAMIPILGDMLCEACSKLTTEEERRNCTEKLKCRDKAQESIPSFAAGSSSITTSSLGFALRPSSAAKGKALAKDSVLIDKVHKSVYSGISNKLKPDDHSRVVIAKITSILCKLCERITDQTKRQDCLEKFKCTNRSSTFSGISPSNLRIQDQTKKPRRGKLRRRSKKPRGGY